MIMLCCKWHLMMVMMMVIMLKIMLGVSRIRRGRWQLGDEKNDGATVCGMWVQTTERTCVRFTVQYSTFSHPEFMLLVTVHRRFHISYSRHFLFTLSTRLYWHFVVCRDPGLMEVVGDARGSSQQQWSVVMLSQVDFDASCVSNNNSQAVFWEQSDYSVSRTSLYNKERWQCVSSRPRIKDLLRGRGYESNWCEDLDSCTA